MKRWGFFAKRAITFLIALYAPFLMAEEEGNPPDSTTQERVNQEVLVKGLILSTSPEVINSYAQRDIDGIVTFGLPFDLTPLKEKLLPLFYEKPLFEVDKEKIKEEIVQFFQKENISISIEELYLGENENRLAYLLYFEEEDEGSSVDLYLEEENPKDDNAYFPTDEKKGDEIEKEIGDEKIPSIEESEKMPDTEEDLLEKLRNSLLSEEKKPTPIEKEEKSHPSSEEMQPASDKDLGAKSFHDQEMETEKGSKPLIKDECRGSCEEVCPGQPCCELDEEEPICPIEEEKSCFTKEEEKAITDISKGGEEKEDKILIPELKGIYLYSPTNDGKDILDDTLGKHEKWQESKGIQVRDISLPQGGKKLICSLERFLNHSLTKEDLCAIKLNILEFYKENMRPLVLVQVPEQNVSSGILHLEVIESRLGEVRAVCNRYFSSCEMQKAIEIKPGEIIDEKVLVKDIAFLNKNPFRRVDAVYTPGEREYTTDIELLTSDEKPFRVYVGTENNGLDLTGKDRFFVGFNAGNLWHLAHLFNYRFTSSYKPSEFQAHTFQYQAPLPNRHILQLFGGYSTVHADIPPFNTRDNSGYSAQASIRYEIPITIKKEYTYDWIFGFDFKRTDNTIEYSEVSPVFAGNVNLTQFVVGTKSTFTNKRGSASTLLEFFYSPGSWLPSQSNGDYNALRNGAKNNFFYVKQTNEMVYNLPKKFMLYWKYQLQLSASNLLPSEQLGLGGYNSIRGYDERLYNADNGVVSNLEIRTPAIPIFQKIWRRTQDRLLFLFFFDYGYGWLNTSSDIYKRSEYLMSVGPGMRYVIDPYLSLYVDWGIQMRHVLDNKENVVHIGATLSY